LGSQYENQYLLWDGTTLTVRGDVRANSVEAGILISSPTIAGGVIKTALYGSRIELNSSYTSELRWYDSNDNLAIAIYPDASGNLIISTNGIIRLDTTTQVGGSILLDESSGIRFYSPSRKGGNFWYENGNLYFRDEDGNKRTISYT
jgi:hypothetical protein